MRKNLIAMSVATLVAGLGMAGGAAANVLLDNGALSTSTSNATFQEVRPGGIGHQLIVPYFNTQEGNATLFNIVNTDGVNGKAVKVRFRGASNSDDLFDFQVYLSPNDMWTATVTQTASGLSVLTTSDTSCTIPSLLSGQPFVTARLPAGFTDAQKATQTREGYIEIFNMADVPPNLPSTATGAATATANPLFTSTKHPANGRPTCAGAAIANLANDPATTPDAYAMGFRAPTGTIFANWTIINVPKSGAATGEATALVATVGAGGPQGNGNIVFSPQLGAAVTSISPDLATADPALRTINGGVTGVTIGDAANTGYTTSTGRALPIITALQFDLPDLSTPYLSNQFPLTAASPLAHAEQLTRAISTMQVVNEFITDTTISANTDWVFSMPTRRYSVALDYRVAPVNAARAFSRFPNRDYFTAANTNVNAGNTQICVLPNNGAAGALTYWDREENSPSAPPTQFVISPGTPVAVAAFQLCGEASVLIWNAAGGASVLGASISTVPFSTQAPGFRDGWARLATPGVATGQALGGVAPSAGGNGLPILGKAFIRASNPGAALATGGLANFGGSWEHRYVRPVTP